jgi:hypothetical protein
MICRSLKASPIPDKVVEISCYKQTQGCQWVALPAFVGLRAIADTVKSLNIMLD